MVALLLTAYFLTLGALAALGLHRLLLTGVALRRSPPGDAAPLQEHPTVLVQLPIYDEALVAERLLRQVARLSWPRERLRIQVLDDSSDDTRALVSRTAAELAASGVPIEVLHRPSREGYKAGALAHGLSLSSAELVAIFDADFLPAPDFLERTVPPLVADARLGLVQARWGHRNRDHSALTRAQAIFLDAHFSVEHLARQRLGHYFNFNGTAGVWRRTAIEQAGGWSHDTITEDLDLSYRAQLAGWRFRYLDEVLVPAELPETWRAFRGQQGRWVRGSVETARKLLGRVLTAPGLSLGARLDAAVHLTQNVSYLLMALLAVLLPAAVLVRGALGWRVPGGEALLSALDLSMLGAGTGAVLLFYALALLKTGAGLGPRRALDLLFALCVGAGMSLSNAQAVLAGAFSKGSTFVRTPTRGDAAETQALRRYPAGSALGRALLELSFALGFALATARAISLGLWGALPFLSIYLVGFIAVGLGGLPGVRVAAPAERRMAPHAG